MRACLLALLLGGFAAAPVLAQPLGTAFTYQGELQDGGLPASGPHDLRFRLFDAAAGGAQVGPTLCSDNVPLADGRFSVSLDFGAQFAGLQRFLEVEVRPDTGLNCGSGAGFVTLSPRQALTVSPHAAFSLGAATAVNATQLNGQGATFYQNAGNLTAGTIPNARLGGTYSGVLALTSPFNTFAGSGAGLVNLNASNLTSGTVSNARLAVPLSLSGSVDFSGVILGANGSTSGYGVFGYSLPASGETYGTGGESASSSGTGVLGIASAVSGGTRGVKGVSYSPLGRGVLGVSEATSGSTVGVQGESSAGNPTGTGVVGKAQATGGWFEANGAGGTGLFGVATDSSATPNAGVEGRAHGTAGAGVRGVAFASQGYTSGVSGTTHSGLGIGVEGIAALASGYASGVYGESAGPDGRGVFGHALSPSGSARGVAGQSDSVSGTAVWGWAAALSGVTYGVVGTTNSGQGWAVYADGRLGASGTKSFRIDHPSDPENKYLVHYSAESPEVINFYSGKVTLDERGRAVVELPDYFASINRDPRYTLTAIGAAMPLLHVSEEIDEESLRRGERVAPGEALPRCSFRISGGVPGAKVSWRVDAVRNDRWVRDMGAPVEIEKEELERGTYQNPDLYGQPPQRRTNHTHAEHPRPGETKR